MRRRLFIISDLHLGGIPDETQICGSYPALEEFIRWTATSASTDAREQLELVINGDIVDFLAPDLDQAGKRVAVSWHDTDEGALAALERAIARAGGVFRALADFRSAGHALTLLLGNHDLELALPSVRRFLLDTLGPGRIEFLYDNEAFTLGPVLIEHGNRYDEWNAVRHGALREARSHLSRREPAAFPAPPGSELVAQVMNALKTSYSFVDLLKPETAGVLPVLAALGAPNLHDVWQFFVKYRQTADVTYDNTRQPLEETFIARSVDPDQDMYDLAQAIAADGDATYIGQIGDRLRAGGAALSEAAREYRRTALLKALRAFVAHHQFTFDIDRENWRYLAAAAAAAERRFEVVVYGHTHLVKRVPLKGADGTDIGVYLNTGTWADLMRVPDEIWGDEAAARVSLDHFLRDLEDNKLARWRRPVPTYARIDVVDDRVSSAEVYIADGRPAEPATTAGVRQRLAARDTDD